MEKEIKTEMTIQNFTEDPLSQDGNFLTPNEEENNYCDMKCYFCEEKFKTYHFLNKHLEEIHNVEKIPERNGFNFKCYICKKSLKTYWYLRKHMEENHSEENSILKKHKENVHEKNKLTLRCEICKISFTTKYFLTKHMDENHENDNYLKKQYQCSICKIRFKLKVSYDEHVEGFHKGNKATIDQTSNSTETNDFNTENNPIFVSEPIMNQEKGSKDNLLPVTSKITNIDPKSSVDQNHTGK